MPLSPRSWCKVRLLFYQLVSGAWRTDFKNEKPYLMAPNGKVIELEVRDYVQFLCSKSNQRNLSAVASSSQRETPRPRVKVMASSSSPESIHGDDDDDDEDEPFSPDDEAR